MTQVKATKAGVEDLKTSFAASPSSFSSCTKMKWHNDGKWMQKVLCFWPIRSEQIVCVILANQTQANCVFDTDAPEWFSIFSSKVVAWKDLDKKAQKIFSLKIRTLSFLVGRSWTTPHMLEYVREISPSLQNRLLCVRMSGSGCGSVGRAVATNSRGPWFKSSQQRFSGQTN